MPHHNRLPLALFFLRISVFLVMFMWTLDKFIRFEHAAKVFEHFYFIGNITQTAMLAVAIIELAILFCFLVGFIKRFSYGFVFVIHAISTLSSYRQYFAPFENVNLLFFAAWPMLAACFTLYYLRDQDTFLTISK